MKKGKKLKQGDRLAAVTLSWGGPGEFPHRYEAGKRQLEAEFGVELVAMPNALKPDSWLARNPRARADDLMQAFLDPRIDGIISTIGGDDSVRLLPFIDPEVIAAHPKVFMGYSDTTVSHFMCYQAGLVSFYGPSVMAGFGENGGLFPYMVDSVRRTLFSSDPVGVVNPNVAGWTKQLIGWDKPENQSIKKALQPSSGWQFLQGGGQVTGRLLGGCVPVLQWMYGTRAWLPAQAWEGVILFLETSEEGISPATFKQVLRNFAAQGILGRLRGLLIGRPGGEFLTAAAHAEFDQVTLEVVRDEEGLEHLPVVSQMDFGHSDPMFVLPLGVEASIDVDRREFCLLESGVD